MFFNLIINDYCIIAWEHVMMECMQFAVLVTKIDAFLMKIMFEVLISKTIKISANDQERVQLYLAVHLCSG